MTQRRTPWGRLLPGALVVVLLYMGLGSTAFVAPAEAAPSQELVGSTGPLSVGGSSAEGAQPRFAYRVMGQATATNTPTPTATATATVTPTPVPGTGR